MTRKKIHELFRYLISFIYPNVCAGCGCTIVHNGDFCEECHNKLVMYDGSFEVEYVDDFTACCIYEGVARDAILSFKHDSRGNAYYAFACGIYDKLKQSGLNQNIDIVTCIPMYPSDLDERGYNQAELIAKELRFMLNVPFYELLIKIRKTRSQKTLSGEERHANVSNVFSAYIPELVSGKNILIVDDVCTTGSTLSEAARTLKMAGANRVIAAAFAKTLKNNDNDENEEKHEDFL